MWHSWRTWLNVAAVLVLLVVVGCLVYNAAVWASRGYDSVWKDYFPRILFYLVFGIFFLVRLLILPESRSRKYISKLSAVYGDPVALTITYSFGDDSYQTKTSDGATINTAYDQILSVYETTHGIIMERKMHLFESLDPGRNTSGIPGLPAGKDAERRISLEAERKLKPAVPEFITQRPGRSARTFFASVSSESRS